MRAFPSFCGGHALAMVASAVVVFLAMGCGKSEQPGSQPAPATPAQAASTLAPADGAGWRASLKGLAIPEHPAHGTIHGRPFSYEKAAINEGILTLRQGKDFFADLKLVVFLFLEEGAVPAGKAYRVARQKSFGTPHIHISWKDSGQTPKTDMFMNEYVLLLEFGEERDKKLPGRIYAALPDSSKSWVAGTFDAEIRGFRLIDGKPDLSADSFKLLRYLAQAYLEARNPGQPVKIVETKDGMYSHPGPAIKYQTGFEEVVYRVGDGPPTRQRFQFVKENGRWGVLRTLKKTQLHYAHPYHPPDPKGEPMRVFRYLAAQRLEGEAQQEFPGKGISGVRFRTGYNPRVKLGRCVVTYRLEGEAQDRQKAFLFRLHEAGWRLDRALAEDETINYKTGRVEKTSG